jgi:guanylate kinase
LKSKSINELIFAIDYQATRNITKKFFTDMSFSFITWKNIEELRDGEL